MGDSNDDDEDYQEKEKPLIDVVVQPDNEMHQQPEPEELEPEEPEQEPDDENQEGVLVDESSEGE